MYERRESGFDRIGRFLVNLALLVLLGVGLWRVVSPEVYHLINAIRGGQQAETDGAQKGEVINSTLPPRPSEGR